jgi:ribosomal protein S12 methylthiotransferase
VDGLVYVKGNANLNEIVPVVITATDDYDLYGMTAEEAKVF